MKKLITLIIAIAFTLPMMVHGQGCMEPKSDDGVSIIGYIQPQFNYYINGYDKNSEKIDDYSSFMFKRARLGVTGQIPYDFSYYVMAEFSPFLFGPDGGTANGPYLLDAFITYKRLGPWLNISIGQFKVPFGLELTTPCQALHTIDRSLVVRMLASPFRDMGIMLSGGTDSLEIFGLTNKNIISYRLAVTNGTGINKWDDNNAKDITGRVILSPWKFIKLGGSYRTGKHFVDATKPYGQNVIRYGGDIELRFGNFLFQGEYIYGEDQDYHSTGTGGGGCGGDAGGLAPGTVKKEGFFVQAMYMTGWRLQPIVKYEYYDPNVLSTGKDDNIISGTFGLNYFFNDWTRLQVNYVVSDYQKNSIPTDDYYLNKFEVQVQVIF